ncbi:MAG: hypothetical protein CMF23_03970 [Ignavibacteriae bacterium]|nr:hypothetical protein [Ignavibacteriota bacterium]
MISKNIIKNEYTHRIIESKQNDRIEIGSKEYSINDSIFTLQKNQKNEIFPIENYQKSTFHFGKKSIFSLNTFLIIFASTAVFLILYTILNQVITGRVSVSNNISSEALFSIGFYFLLTTFTIPFFLYQKKFVLKIKKEHLDIKLSLNKIESISLNEIIKCRIMSKDFRDQSIWSELDLSARRKSYRANNNSSIAVFLKDGRCLLFGIKK